MKPFLEALRWFLPSLFTGGMFLFAIGIPPKEGPPAWQAWFAVVVFTVSGAANLVVLWALAKEKTKWRAIIEDKEQRVKTIEGSLFRREMVVLGKERALWEREHGRKAQ